MQRSPTSRLVLLAALLAWPACGGEKPATTPQAAPPAESAPAASAQAASKAAAEPAAGEGEKVKVVDGPPPGEGDRYVLAVEPPPKARAGEAVAVRVAVTPKEPWHMNLDYPTSLEVRPPADAAVAKPKLKKSDAARLDEKGAEFRVEVTPKAPGAKSFTGTFKFAVCQDEACAPVTETIAFELNVEPKS